MKQMSRDEIIAQIAPLTAQVNAIDRKERREEQKALVGKCFKYHNSLGSHAPKWWMCSMVTGVGQYYVKGFEFQSMSNREIRIERAKNFHVLGGHIEISKAEYLRAWKKLQKHIAGYTPKAKQ